MSRKLTYRFSLTGLARALTLAVMLPALASCVTYYYPVPEQSDGVYYAADDPGYRGSGADYAAVSYYPWWGVDYFYLGYGYYGSGVSLGLSFGYPWRPAAYWSYYPYGYASWYYDPWRVSWYYPSYYYGPWYGYPHYNAYWHVHNRYYDRYSHGGRDHHRRGDRDHYNRGDRGNVPYDPDRFAGRYGRDRLDEPTERRGGHDLPTGYGRDGMGSWEGTGSQQRRVSVAPGSGTTDRGMVVSSRDGGKWSRSRLEPVGARSTARVTDRGTVSAEPNRAPDYQLVRRGTTTVGRPVESKPSRSRTTPTSPPVVVTNRSGQATGSSSDGATYRRPAMAPPTSRGAELPRGSSTTTGPSRTAPPRSAAGFNRSYGQRPANNTGYSSPPPRSAPAPRSAPSRSSGPSRSVSRKSVSKAQPRSGSSKSRDKRDR
jgi:hypothetical protein